MKMRVKVGATLLFGIAAVACKDPLVADNPNNPDIEKIFRQPASIEASLLTGYQTCRNNEVSTNAVQQLQARSFEVYSQLNNFNMGPASGIPRVPNLNNKATQTLGGGTFSTWQRGARTAGNALAALDRLTAAGGTIASKGRDLRARAYGFLDMACNLGWMAAIYDSAGIVSHEMSSDSVPPLSGYDDVAARTLQYLDSAIDIASDPQAASGFPGPFGDASLSAAEFVQLMHSFKARFATIVTRSTAERDALNWAAVQADADAGITSDVVVTVGGTSGWSFDWLGNQGYVDATWHQITPTIMGEADVSGGYDAWLAKPYLQRDYFLIQSPDLRWPAGSSRSAQQAASLAPGSYHDRPYIRNRTDDSAGDAWGESFYSWQRYLYYKTAGSVGQIPEFMQAENDLIGAEAAYRLGNFAKAAQLIDRTRVANGGLPALTGVITNGTQAVPGGANCVPRVPAAPNFTSTTCGNIWEALKYEKRMELAFNHLCAWFCDSRGWQDLVKDTPLHYPVPVDELDARQLPYYNTGGGQSGSAPANTSYGSWGFPN